MAAPTKKYFYITTPIYYASGNPHIGHAYATISADVIARYKRELGKEVFFLTGTDEHGEKIQKNAEKAGMEPKEFVDKMADTFQKLWKDLKISNNDFIRTTDDRHMKCVQEVFSYLYSKGDIYKGTYKGWYCLSDEAYYTDSQVGEDHLCPECHREVVLKDQECYFLNCKKYLPKLLDFYNKHPQFVPNGKLNEMIKTFIEPGLEDLCITRTNFSWGVPVKEDPKHVVYVWIDALLNYISALGYKSGDESRMNKFWSKDSQILQLAGREINRFHTIYWPILLFALNLRLPNTVFIHGLLLTRSGEKLSKSLGNAPSPYPIIDRYGLDALRYYIAREIILGDDGNFTPKQFVSRFNNDLVNNFGNLVNRTISMVNKYFDGKLTKQSIGIYYGPKAPESLDLQQKIDMGFSEYKLEMEAFNASKALAKVMEISDCANKYIETMTPWNLAKENKLEELSEVMYMLCESIRCIAIMLKPVLVDKSIETLDQLNIPAELRSFQSISKHNKLYGLKVNKPERLFPRLDEKVEVEYLASLIEEKHEASK